VTRANKSHSILVDAPLELTLDAIEEASHLWGGTWEPGGRGGEIELPVAAGVRRGRVAGELRATPEGGGTRLRFNVENSNYRLQGREIVVLLVGAISGLFLMVAPFVVPLWSLIPMAGLLLLLAWFLVVARLQNHSPPDFLLEVQAVAKSRDD